MESVNEIDELCRLCGSDEGIKVSIFEPGTDHVKKIHKILPISINEHDFLPKIMCHRCSCKVNDFYEFRLKCIRAQDSLKSKLPWLQRRMTCDADNEHPPMVQLPLNSLNAISPSEKNAIDESEPLIVIEDDSPPFQEIESVSLNENHIPHEKIIMKIKRSELKKRSKVKSVWETKKRRKRTYNSCRITEVFTTTMDEYENIADIENDPLGLPVVETNENQSNNKIVLDANVKNEQKKENLTNDEIKLPAYILVTNIPRVGFVYTCEKCGRTFLSPQPASLHTCIDKGNESKDQNTSSNNTTDFYNCNECNQMFSRHSQLIAHKRKHYEIVMSSSDDSDRIVSHRKKHRRNNKVKSDHLKIASPPTKIIGSESGIIVRHSLLSSDSD